MSVAPSRPTASRTRRILFAAFAASLLTGVLSSTAMASTEVAPEPEANPAPAQVNSELAVCPGQTFAQPFMELGDSNYYTLVEGSEFERSGEGWTLLGGAKIVEGTRPDGARGGVLDLPSGSIAMSPPVCVTLQYPTARTWAEAGQSGGTISVAVLYNTGNLGRGLPTTASVSIGSVSSEPGAGWQLSQPFNVNPQLGGASEGVREARFVYTAVGRRADYHVSGLFVDPRFGN